MLFFPALGNIPSQYCTCSDVNLTNWACFLHYKNNTDLFSPVGVLNSSMKRLILNVQNNFFYVHRLSMGSADVAYDL